MPAETKKPSVADQYGPEFARYFDPVRRKLVSVREDGVILARGVGDADWSVIARKKTMTLIEWKGWKIRQMYLLPTWCRRVRCLPTMACLERWSINSVCETTSGDTVEPDGYGPDDAPSWLIALGIC